MGVKMEGIERKLPGKKNGNCCPVAVITLERLLQKYDVKKVDLLIIDVEGAELPVLGSFPWQSASVEKIFYELHPYAWKDFDYCAEDFRKFLRDHGYRCFDMYFQEHNIFKSAAYIGPSILVPSR